MNKYVKKNPNFHSDNWIRRLIINSADWSALELNEGVKRFNTDYIYLVEFRPQHVVYYFGEFKWTKRTENGPVNGEQGQNVSHEGGKSIEMGLTGSNKNYDPG